MRPLYIIPSTRDLALNTFSFLVFPLSSVADIVAIVHSSELRSLHAAKALCGMEAILAQSMPQTRERNAIL